MPASVFDRVLVGWDGSRAAAEGLRIACGLTAVAGGSVTALAVIPDFAHIEADDDRARAVNDALEPLRATFEQVVATLVLHPDQQVSLRFLEDAHVGAALDRYATEQLVDLLVVGLHGREGVLHPKMGHIANHVVKSSSSPVLIIPDPRAPGTAYRGESTLADTVKGLFHPGHRHPETV
jgi:nucleotide-binding universal stress UspA family protein